MRKLLALLLVGVLVLAGMAWVVYHKWLATPDEGPATYVGSQACIGCHQTQGQQWQGSHHQQAMALATADTVLGNFDNRQFTHQGTTSRFFRQDDRYFIHTDGPSGKMADFPIKYTFGIEPLQQYLVELNAGRMQALPIAWDTLRKRWFHLYPDEKKLLHDDPLHWTRPLQNWNYMCAECHSTNLQRNYDLAQDSYQTTFAEISVGCEACHGPGSTHVELANTWSLLRDRRWDRNTGYCLAVINNAKAEIDTCAMCHSRRAIVAPDFKPSHDFLDHYAPELLDKENIYFPDGQIRDEVYEYGSFLQSKMYRHGVRCSDCHNPHAARPRAEGNTLCIRCHLPAKYDAPSHHHHAAGSKGALCVECHMPQRPYMVVHPRRDHSIRVPRPDLTVTLGKANSPNACNGCHKDKSAEWARDQVVAWFGPQRPDDPHYGPAIAAGRAAKPEGEKLLLEQLRRKEIGPIVRATAVSLLAGYPSEASRGMRLKALLNPEPLVRFAAVRSLEQPPAEELPGDFRVALAPLLEDKVRLVRIEAARVLSVAAASGLNTKQQQAFRNAFAEYAKSQLATSEQAVAHHNLGIVYANLKRFEQAEAEYQTAVRLDPQFVPARYNLAMLHNQLDNKPAAIRHLQEVTALAPEMADAHYSLGLLLAEDEKRLAEASEALAKAAKLLPKQARVHYNYGLALQRLGKRSEAGKALLAAHQLEPAARDYIYALAILHTQDRRWAEALRWTEQLIRLDPDNPQWYGLRRFIIQSAK